MKNTQKRYIITVMVLTMITVFGILSMRPGENNILLPSTGMGEGPVIGWEQEENREWVIDDDTLDRFIDVYTKEIKGKSLERKLTNMDKREIRLILEDMGYQNTTKLKQVLTKAVEDGAAQEIYRILQENLFDQDIGTLNRIMGME